MVLLLSLDAAPALADAPDGVWSGTLGRSPVAVCFESGLAAYYYLKTGVDIALVEREGGFWEEKRGDQPPTGTWQLSAAKGEALTGTWRSPNGKRDLPIRLRRADDQFEADSPVPAHKLHCRSPGYNATRVEKAMRTRELGKQESKGWLTVRPFTALDDNITGLEIVGDSAELSPLRRTVETINRELLAGYFECMTFVAASGGREFEFSGVVRLEGVTEHFVVVRQSDGYFCAGAHPDGEDAYFVLDRKSGKAVDIRSWLKGSRDAIGRKHWKSTRDDCADALLDDTSFVVWPSGSGMVFRPVLPHVNAACAEDVTVPYAALAGNLTAAGERAAAEFAAAAK
jgi:hypothetical protein